MNDNRVGTMISHTLFHSVLEFETRSNELQVSNMWNLKCSNTVDSRYYDTVGIRKMYQYIQTINITSINLYNLVLFGRQIWYRNEKHFDITDIVISRDHCSHLSRIDLSRLQST
jgi:hypothetical protein